jgi:hypothetical protein
MARLLVVLIELIESSFAVSAKCGPILPAAAGQVQSGPWRHGKPVTAGP